LKRMTNKRLSFPRKRESILNNNNNLLLAIKFNDTTKLLITGIVVGNYYFTKIIPLNPPLEKGDSKLSPPFRKGELQVVSPLF